jgi:hypothetical protein
MFGSANLITRARLFHAFTVCCFLRGTRRPRQQAGDQAETICSKTEKEQTTTT